MPVAAFKLNEPLLLDNFRELSTESIIKLNVFDVRAEKRFHKSGYFRGCIISYQIPSEKEVYFLDGEQVCFLGKKYEAIDKVEAAVNSAEFAATTAAGFMMPGSDIIYYFTRGAIQNKKGDEVILRRYYIETN